MGKTLHQLNHAVATHHPFSGKDTNDTAFTILHRRFYARFHANHRYGEALAKRFNRCRGGRIAGHDQCLGAESYQPFRHHIHPLTHIGRRLVAIGDMRGIGRVEQGLLRQQRVNLTQNRQAAGSRVEDANRCQSNWISGL